MPMPSGSMPFAGDPHGMPSGRTGSPYGLGVPYGAPPGGVRTGSNFRPLLGRGVDTSAAKAEKLRRLQGIQLPFGALPPPEPLPQIPLTIPTRKARKKAEEKLREESGEEPGDAMAPVSAKQAEADAQKTTAGANPAVNGANPAAGASPAAANAKQTNEMMEKMLRDLAADTEFQKQNQQQLAALQEQLDALLQDRDTMRAANSVFGL